MNSSHGWKEISFEIWRNVKIVGYLFFQHILFKKGIMNLELQAVSRKLLIRFAMALA